MRRPAAWIAAAVVALAVIAYLLVLPAVRDVSQFGTLSRSGPPPRIDWCQVRYYAGTRPVTRQEVDAFPDSSRLAPILRTPSGMEVIAAPLTAAERIQLDAQACSMVLYLELGGGRYLPYLPAAP